MERKFASLSLEETLQPPWPSMEDVERHRCTFSADDSTDRTGSPPQVPEVRTLSGPVALEDAIALGMPAAVCSFLLEVEVDQQLRNRVIALIPAEAAPHPADTAKILAGRLRTCAWLDDVHCLRGGCGPGYVPLNSRTYSQPRRVTWSVLARPPLVDNDGDLVFPLFAYPATMRRDSDMRCRPMPMDLFELGLLLWKTVRRCLGSVSQQHPPTVCQLLLCNIPPSSLPPATTTTPRTTTPASSAPLLSPPASDLPTGAQITACSTPQWDGTGTTGARTTQWPLWQGARKC